MNSYVTGAVIRKLREEKKMTQEELAREINVSGKAVSKWETGRGLPDISLIEPLARALGISLAELLGGESARNSNRASNLNKMKFYICPVCGNIIQSVGEASVSCCGITLPACEPEENDEEHFIEVSTVEDEYSVTVNHPMAKDHFISFIAAVSDDGVQFAKMYPESDAQARFKKRRVKYFYVFCNRHGLFRLNTR